MIRKLIVAGLVTGLSACASMQSGQSSNKGYEASSDTSSDQICDSSPVLSLVGDTLTPDLTDSARQRSHSEIARVIHPGEVMTMEYNPVRLNLVIDEHDKIITLHCG